MKEIETSSVQNNSGVDSLHLHEWPSSFIILVLLFPSLSECNFFHFLHSAKVDLINRIFSGTNLVGTAGCGISCIVKLESLFFLTVLGHYSKQNVDPHHTL